MELKRRDMEELPARTNVRFRRDPNKNWERGVTAGVRSKDGSMVLIDKYGKMRSVEDEYIEYEERGPKGGRKWVALLNG